VDRVLLLVEHKGNRRLVAELLSLDKQVIVGESADALNEPFDLCILDSLALAKLWQAIGARKQLERPTFLPTLLLTPRHDVGVGTRRLWESVDELIVSPIEKGELRARVEILLRARRLSRENETLRRQLEAELERAAQVQTALLPETAPALAGFELAACCLPAREVGGDFYDWQAPDPSRLALTLGDVSGKGMPAALLMATIRASLRAVSRLNTPATALELVSHALAVDLERSGNFVTLFHAVLSVADRRLTYADAGHGYSFVRRRDGRVEEPATRGMPLGAFADAQYRDDTIELGEGDALVIHSDGLVDARRDRGLTAADFARGLDGTATARGMCERLLQIAAPPTKLPDDLTVVVLRCLSGS
jgi:sigma-B regulation protein RsbU (phosphoserine phosphatase)